MLTIKKPPDYPRYTPKDDDGAVLGGRRCIAWLRQNVRRCNAPAMWGKDVCRMHGGKSLSGYAHPGLKDGWYSKDFFASLWAKRKQSEAKRRKAAIRAVAKWRARECRSLP